MDTLQITVLVALIASYTAEVTGYQPNYPITQICPPTRFLCKGEQRCINAHDRCDGQIDCKDGSDEAGCSTQPPIVPPVVPPICPPTRFLCNGEQRCINAHDRCDGQIDCKDGSDEAGCSTQPPIVPPVVPPTCAPPRFLCNGEQRCINAHDRCDGQFDCKDGSDEAGCSTQPPIVPPVVPPVKCRPDEFYCRTELRCIPQVQRCNGQVNCNDGSDELGCPTTTTTTERPTTTTTTGSYPNSNCSPCSHGCVNEGNYGQVRCYCPRGMRLWADQTTCYDDYYHGRYSSWPNHGGYPSWPNHGGYNYGYKGGYYGTRRK